jgi:hypothetical protein
MTTATRLNELIDRAKGIVATAEAENRKLSRRERAEVNDILAQADAMKDTLTLQDQIDGLRGGHVSASESGGFAQAVIDAGFGLKSQPSVELPSSAVFASTLPNPDVWRVGPPTIAPLGQDKRFLYSNLPSRNVEGVSAVADFKQTARTLTGTPVRDLDAVTDKASLDVTLQHVVEELKMVAVTINSIPNMIFESVDSMRAYLNSEGAFQVQKALDGHVMAQIVAASPPFGTSGTGLVAKIRNGVATMRATGANPSIVVLNPTDAASLDLEADAGGYIFPTRDSGSSSPLWGLKVVERIGAGTEAPYLIDPQMLGQLYLGNMRFEADPFSEFKKNLTTLRNEVKALYHIRQGEGARRIAAA